MPATNLPPTRSVNVIDYTPYIDNPDGVDGSIHSNDPSAVNNNTKSASSTLFNIALTTAGRFSFYIDYSERSTPGLHTFYVQRTHGTVGAVSVSYSTSGDTHNVTSGTLSWSDGQAGVQSFTVNVPDKTVAGDHRIVATLSNATGGAVLHHGAKTIAYGVIDDGTIASDADAVFYDSAATGGTGTQADPYGSIYTAIANVGAKRYLYLKGSHTADGTNTTSQGTTYNVINMPAGRTSESTRLYIQAWPGFTFTVNGDITNKNAAGFFAKDISPSYHTWRNIDFTNIDTTGIGGTDANAAFGIYYFYGGVGGGSTDINAEYLTGDNFNGGTNSSLFAPWGVIGAKVWRCSVNNFKYLGSLGPNSAGIQHYSCTNLCVQRCDFTLVGRGVFEKRTEAGSVAGKIAFNIFDNGSGPGYYQGFGSGTQEWNYAIIQSNVFKTLQTYEALRATGSAGVGGRNWIFNNVFYRCAAAVQGAIKLDDVYDNQIANNIFYSCYNGLSVNKLQSNQSAPAREVLDYLDYNYYHDADARQTYYHQYYNVYYSNLSGTGSLNAVYPAFAANTTAGTDPLFGNPATNDFTLGVGSAALTSGVNATESGIYLTGNEVIGS